MRISDWSSDVCSSDVLDVFPVGVGMTPFVKPGVSEPYPDMAAAAIRAALTDARVPYSQVQQAYAGYVYGDSTAGQRSEEHTSELQSIMRISYAVFCLKKKKH